MATEDKIPNTLPGFSRVFILTSQFRAIVIHPSRNAVRLIDLLVAHVRWIRSFREWRRMMFPAPIFEGRLGLFKQVSGEANIDVGQFGGRRNSFRINRCGMKAYPAVVYTQTAIIAAIAVADEVTKSTPVGYDRAAALQRIASIEI